MLTRALTIAGAGCLLLGGCNAVLGIDDRPAQSASSAGGGGAATTGSVTGSGGSGATGGAGGGGDNPMPLSSIDALWATRLGGSAADYLAAASFGAANNVLLAGGSWGDVGAASLQQNQGGADILAAELSAAGDVLWTRLYGDVDDQLLFGATLDPQNGGLWLAGQFTGYIYDGPDYINAGTDAPDAFVIRVAGPAGEIEAMDIVHGSGTQTAWAVTTGSPNGNSVPVLALGNDGGMFAGTTYFPQGPQIQGAVAATGQGSQAPYQLPFAGSSSQFALGIAYHAQSTDVVVAGGFVDGTLDVFDKSLASAGNSDAFVTRIAADGSALWLRGFGGTEFDRFDRVAFAPNGDILLLGSISGGVQFVPGETLTSSGAEPDICIVRLSGSGTVLWARTFAGVGRQVPLALSVRDDGFIFFGGLMNGNMLFDELELIGDGAGDPFAAALDPSGRVRWAQRFDDDATMGPSGFGEPAVMALDATSDGRLLIGGNAVGNLSFDATTTLAPLGDSDIFVAVLDASVILPQL